MMKLGDAYQEIVGTVAKVLDPGATVNVGQWVKGPDGRRDMDVEVRGSIGGESKFILIECKDWKRVVGIKEIDALDSKRHDLGADDTIIYSNYGFSKAALRKARRKGIGACSALKAGDKRIKLVFFRQLVAKSLSIDQWTPILFYPKGHCEKPSASWDIKSLKYKGDLVLNWISNVSSDILCRHEDSNEVAAYYAFSCPFTFELDNNPIELTGIGFHLKCSKWVAQEVQVDVSIGLYDHIRKRIIIPDKQAYILGCIDPKGWEEIDTVGWKPPEEGCMELYLTLLNPVKRGDAERVPDLDSIIKEREVKCSN